MGDFVLGNRPELMGEQRHDGQCAAGQRHEFHRKAFAALVDKDDGADVTLGQAMLRQIGGQHYAIEFFDHRVRRPMDTPWLK